MDAPDPGHVPCLSGGLLLYSSQWWGWRMQRTITRGYRCLCASWQTSLWRLSWVAFLSGLQPKLAQPKA